MTVLEQAVYNIPWRWFGQPPPAGTPTRMNNYVLNHTDNQRSKDNVQVTDN